MNVGLDGDRTQCRWSASAALMLLIAFICPLVADGQTSSTGALTGVSIDPTGALLPGAVVRLANLETGAIETATSDAEGRFDFPLLRPGGYEVQATRSGAADLVARATINVPVTETIYLELRFRLATVSHNVKVLAEPTLVQTEDPALGRVVDTAAVNSLPLVTRNFAQIASLSPGVITGVSNAGELGLGGTALGQIAKSNDGLFVHGARSYENDWQLDGVSVSNVQNSGAGSGGIPIPNPDAIQQFKVQTGLYDAAYGRYAGANISVITKSGGDKYHGTVFEYFRNDVLNANDYFRNQTNQPRPVLKQNQFGFALGGPFKKDKLLFFGSYQGTRQVNGIAAGQSRIACSATLSSPPLTNDRTPGELGKLFGGMTGALGGIAVKADGSNINPVALSLLNFKLPDGSFLIPTPQSLDPSKPFASQGFSDFSEPCNFDEDQFLANVDYLLSQRSTISARFFFADNSRTVAFPGNAFNPVANIPGFSSPSVGGNRVFSTAYTHAMSNRSLNDLRFGYIRTRNSAESRAPLKWSDIGVTEGEMSQANELPNLNILGSVAFSSAFPFGFAQNSFVLSDVFSFVRGRHTLRVGGSLTRLQDNFSDPGIGSFVQFLGWPDFLLGLSASGNGSSFSNIFASLDDFGLFDREYRVWESSVFLQDDFRIRRSLTLNAGIRYERLGQFGDRLGRNSSFDINEANPNPGPEGSVAGYLVASNFPGVPPVGVVRTGNTLANDGEGQNTFAPRVGFAWKVAPNSDRLVLRGGYGLYFSRPTGQAFFQGASAAPFALLRTAVGATNGEATFEAPFAQPFPTSDSFPLFPAYSPLSATTIYTTPPGFRPALIQQYSINIQVEPLRDWLLEAGYVGTRGTHSLRVRSLNQALNASSEKPIRGVTSDTLDNVPLRVPIVGIPADSLDLVESEGRSGYNGLEASLTKRLRHGLQFLASYTFSKTLDTDGADINGTGAGIVLTLGDQNSPRQRWGRASFDRTHRFVFSETWDLPSPQPGVGRAMLGGWSLATVITIQSGSALTIADTNAKNVFGISEDRAQLSGTCAKSQLVRAGSVESKLNGYFDANCFTTPPVIGADGIGTAFGNSATGVVDGPGQANLDISLSKTVILRWPIENGSLEFRGEYFNVLNHTQFANPDTSFTSPTFGFITSTAVNARVGQLALKFAF